MVNAVPEVFIDALKQSVLWVKGSTVREENQQHLASYWRTFLRLKDNNKYKYRTVGTEEVINVAEHLLQPSHAETEVGQCTNMLSKTRISPAFHFGTT